MLYRLEHNWTECDSRVTHLIESCIETLTERSGAVLLLPTETVYGLCCDASDQAARERIYSLKERDRGKPMQLLVDCIERLDGYGLEFCDSLQRLCRAFCPGPLTIVVDTVGGSGKIGFRIPSHPFMLALLREWSRPLAATSANLSGEPPCLSVDVALAKFAETPDIVVDAGVLEPESLASTVVELGRSGYRLLRTGPIREDEIRRVLSQ